MVVIAAVTSAAVGITVLVLNVLWRRPLLTIAFRGRGESEQAYVIGLSVRNDGERVVRDVYAIAFGLALRISTDKEARFEEIEAAMLENEKRRGLVSE